MYGYMVQGQRFLGISGASFRDVGCRIICLCLGFRVLAVRV